MQFELIPDSEDRKTIFSKPIHKFNNAEEVSNISPQFEPLRKKNLQLKYFIKKILRKNQNINFDEGLESLRKNKYKEELQSIVQPSQHQCFSFFCQAVSNAKNLRFLDISGIDLDPLLAIEIGQAIQKNSSLYEINLSNCKLNSSSLSYIFASIANHQTLQSINLFNNQGFDYELVNDINKFVFKGKNYLKKLKLTHCNLSNTALSFLLRNLKYSKTINELDLSMMEFNADTLTNLGIALQQFKGSKILNNLNIGYSNIKNYGLEVLAQRVNWNIRQINIKEIILKRNFINQQGIQYLESFLRLIQKLQKLDLSFNQIEEINCQNLLERQLNEINLSNNLFSCFPQQFFMNTLIVNLSNNNILTQGAFQLSSIIRQNPQWMELNLSNNKIKSEGFNSIIFGLRDNVSLIKLIVANNNLDSESMITYMINHQQVNIQYLDISKKQIRYAVIFEILKFIKSGALKYFRCSSLPQQIIDNLENRVSFDLQYKESIINIEQLMNKFRNYQQNFQDQQFQLSSYHLRELDFSNNLQILNPILNSLSTFYSRVEVLNISGCKPLTDKGLETLSTFLQKSTIIYDLNLSNLEIGYRSLDSLLIFRKAVLISNLKSLDLSRNQLFKASKIFISEEQISNFKLENIDYSHNGFQAQHSFYLESVLNCYKNLKSLNLSHNNIDFSGLIMIQKFLNKNYSLKNLNLSNQKFCSDDLIIISHIISDQNLNYINIANNNSIKRMKTFFRLCSQQQQKILNFDHFYFDKQNFKNALQVIEKQQKAIHCVQLNCCYFKKKGYERLAKELIKCKKLTMLSVNYNPFIYVDLDKATYLLNETKKMKILQFRGITFIGSSFNQIAIWLQKSTNCHIESIEISECNLNQRWLDEYCQGIGGNKTLKKIIINQCDLGRFDLYSLGKAIAMNEKLQYISVENNNITDNFKNCRQAMTESKKLISLQMLNVSKNPIAQYTLVNLFSPNKKEKQCLQISELNFASCQLDEVCFQQLNLGLQKFQNDVLFNNLLILSLSDNALTDKVSDGLAQFITNSVYLEQLQLQQNKFTSKGMIKIFQAIILIKSLITLNICNNNLNDEIILYLNKLNSSDLLIKFLIIRGNQFTILGQKCLVQILIKNDKLFVDNIWSFVDDNEAYIILQQYIRVGQKYKFDQDSIPDYFKEIQIVNSNLTDKFCENFSNYYPFLNFIEKIDLSDNPFITMNGKTYLFFHLFDQSCEKHNLKSMYISDSKETRKLFDDGLLRYFTLKLRQFLINDNKVYNQQIVGQKNIDRNVKIFGGQCGASILHALNQFLFYLDLVEPPTFIVSTFFVGKFRKNTNNIKIMVFLFWLAFLFQNSLQYRNLIYLDLQNLYSCELNNIIQGKCVQLEKVRLNNVQFVILCFSVIFILEFMQMTFIVIKRKNIKPALKTLDPQILKLLYSKLPTKKEWLFLFYSVYKKFETLPERTLLHVILNIKPSEQFVQEFQTIFTILIIWRAFDQLIVTIVNLIFFLLSNPRQDQAKHLSLLQRNFFYMNHYVPSDILTSFCPIQGFQLNNRIKINYEVIIGLYRIIVIDFPLLIIIYHFFGRDYMKYRLMEQNIKISEFEIWMILIFFKCLISIVSETVKVLMIRPPVVKQNGFNLALAMKFSNSNKSYFVQPQSIKVEETIKQFIKKFQQKREKKIYSQRTESLSLSNIDDSQNDQNLDLMNFDKQYKENNSISSEYSFSQNDEPQSPLQFMKTKFKYKS